MPQSERQLSPKRAIIERHRSMSGAKVLTNGGVQASAGGGLPGTETVVTDTGHETLQVRCYKTLNFHMRCRSSLMLKYRLSHLKLYPVLESIQISANISKI
jgi:hypothetical protein